MAIIIFDLFGTLVEEEQYQYDEALNWLANTYFENRYVELKKLSELFKTKYLDDRKNSKREFSFFDQLCFFENELGIQIHDDFFSIESNFIYIFRKEKLVDGVVELLKYLNTINYRTFIVSNSIFSGTNLKTHLDYLGIGQYVDKVFSSADIGFRKPSIEIFTFVIKHLKINNPKEVYFIGDSFEKDYTGAKKAGFVPILIGLCQGIDGLVIDNIPNLLKYLKKDQLNSLHSPRLT